MSDGWYYVLGGRRYGPVTRDRLRGHWESGLLSADDEVFENDEAEPRRLDDVLRNLPPSRPAEPPRDPIPEPTRTPDRWVDEPKPVSERRRSGPKSATVTRGVGILIALLFLGLAAASCIIPFQDPIRSTWLAGGAVVLAFLVVHLLVLFAIVLKRREGDVPSRRPWLRRLAMLVPTAAILVVMIAKGLDISADEAARNRLIGDVQVFLRKTTVDPRSPRLRGTVLVVDSIKKEVHPVQKKLPESWQPKPGEPPETIVVLTIQRLPTVQFMTGETGYREDAVVQIVLWKEKTAFGTEKVVGHDPPGFVFRRSRDRETITGDLDTPLVEWLRSLPREPGNGARR